MILDLIAAVTPAPTASVETAQHVFGGANSVSFSPVDPLVLYITATGSLITLIIAVLSFAGSVMGLMASHENKKKIQEVHVLVNSQFDEYKKIQALLLESRTAEARAAGKADATARMEGIDRAKTQRERKS